MLETFKDLIQRTRQADATRKEREAVIDLMVMTMYADRFIDASENTALDRTADQINKDATSHLGQYLNTSIAKVRKTIGDDQKHEALLHDISERLGTPRMRTFAYEAAEALARTDGQVGDEEQQFLQSVQHVFHSESPQDGSESF